MRSTESEDEERYLIILSLRSGRVWMERVKNNLLNPQP